MLQIPKTAPFADDEIELLNRVVGTASEKQRAWLAGFLAGVEASTGGVAQSAAAPLPAEPLSIVFASESGNAERLAGDVAKAARKNGLKPTVIDLADLDVAALKDMKRLIFVVSTWGEGDPPSRVVTKYQELMESRQRLDGVAYGVLALGDTAYTEFCAVGKKIDEKLTVLGAKRAIDRVDCDLDFEAPATEWIGRAAKTFAPADAARGTVIAVDFGKPATALKPEILEAEITDLIDLNSSRSDKETIHLALTFENAAPAYEPGDSLDLYVENDPAEVGEILAATGLSADQTLREELMRSRDIQTLSLKNVEIYATMTGHHYVRTMLDRGEMAAWIEGRHLVDLLEHFPIALTAEHLRGITRPLAPRAYSIASSRREAADEAHLLISAVRYDSRGRERKGVASNYIAERRKRGDRVRVKWRPNRHFGLPAPDRDVIMVGPGTGIAPFRAFVQERRAVGAQGRNWLFFGDRSFTHDFLYQLEWQDALKDGSLTRMDVAFSRDQPKKIYVQHRLWERRRDLVDWIDNGAYFYVCGDAKKMAKDVRGMMSLAYADVKAISPDAAEAAVRQIEREKRYLTDTY